MSRDTKLVHSHLEYDVILHLCVGERPLQRAVNRQSLSHALDVGQAEEEGRERGLLLGRLETVTGVHHLLDVGVGDLTQRGWRKRDADKIDGKEMFSFLTWFHSINENRQDEALQGEQVRVLRKLSQCG